MAAWRVKIERDRIAMASAYNSECDSHVVDSTTSEEEESDWSLETTEYESEEIKMFDAPSVKEIGAEDSGTGTPTHSVSFSHNARSSFFPFNQQSGPVLKQKTKKPLPFNALRFLAQSLHVIH